MYNEGQYVHPLEKQQDHSEWEVKIRCTPKQMWMEAIKKDRAMFKIAKMVI